MIEKGNSNQKEKINNTTNNVRFKLKPNTDYLVEIGKAGYKEATLEFNSGFGDVLINKNTFLEILDIVAKSKASLENAIPVSLYFDNDQPDRKTMAVTSTKTYSQSYNQYYARKDKFKNSYLGLFSGRDNKETANIELESFFEDEVRRGFDKYNVFKKQLLIVLESGQDVNVYLRGYASPIAVNDYNTALGKRRVDSIRKEFSSWEGGAFIKYLDSGQLQVTERSFGEETSPKNVSDDPKAPSKSIFSPAASKERRVEIDEINFNQQ